MGSENEVLRRGPVHASVRGVLSAALVIAALTTGAGAIAGIAEVVSTAVGGTVGSSLVTQVPLHPPLVGGDLVSAVFGEADVVVRSAPAGVVAVVAIGAAAGVIARFALGAALVVLLVAVRRRSPFAGAVALAVTLCGAVTMITALVQDGLGVLGDWMIADLLNRTGHGRWPIEAGFDPTLVGLGFGLMVVGLLLSHAAQLQRETAGLV